MRISDWSSDVCSSDLLQSQLSVSARPHRHRLISDDGAGRRGRRWLAPAAGTRQSRRAQDVFDGDVDGRTCCADPDPRRSEEHTSELQSLMRISYAVFCWKKKNKTYNKTV